MPGIDAPIELLKRSTQISKELAVRYAKVPGIHILVREERCTGCGACVRKGYCRFGAIAVVEKKARVDDRRCRGCARCTHLCPRNVFAIELRPPAMVQGTLRRLDGKVERYLK